MSRNDISNKHIKGGLLSLYHPHMKLIIVDDKYHRWQEIRISQADQEIYILNVYIPNKNDGPNTIHRRLQADMTSNGDFREAVEALFEDLTEKVNSLAPHPVFVGGDLNANAHAKLFAQFAGRTQMIDLASVFGNTQPTFKLNISPPDKVFINQCASDLSQSFQVTRYDWICLSDHAGIIIDISANGVQEYRRSSDRILSSKNSQNFKRFLKRVEDRLDKSKIIEHLEVLKEKTK